MYRSVRSAIAIKGRGSFVTGPRQGGILDCVVNGVLRYFISQVVRPSIVNRATFVVLPNAGFTRRPIMYRLFSIQ